MQHWLVCCNVVILATYESQNSLLKLVGFLNLCFLSLFFYFCSRFIEVFFVEFRFLLTFSAKKTQKKVTNTSFFQICCQNSFAKVSKNLVLCLLPKNLKKLRRIGARFFVKN